MGRLMLANCPPFALSQVQTFGGVYVGKSDIGDSLSDAENFA